METIQQLNLDQNQKKEMVHQIKEDELHSGIHFLVSDF